MVGAYALMMVACRSPDNHEPFAYSSRQGVHANPKKGVSYTLLDKLRFAW